MPYEITPDIPVLDESLSVAGDAFIAGESVASGADVDFQWVSTEDTIAYGFALYILIADGDVPSPASGAFPIPETAKPDVCLVPDDPQDIDLCD